jgi:hypothetical protein
MTPLDPLEFSSKAGFLQESDTNRAPLNLDQAALYRLLTTQLQCYALKNEYQQKLSRDEK